jgi:C_GCAxxG_C_C family probable redox protein
MSKVEQAVSCFEEGFSCAQAVLSAYGPQFGLERELALRVAGAFGGGMGRMGRTCGAVTGALMAIGLQYGKTEAEDDETKEACYNLAGKFVEQFELRHGAITCQELLGYKIGIPEERELAKEQGLFDTLCPKLVRDAAEIVEQLLKP